MKVLVIGVDSLPNYKNKRTDESDPSVIVHLLKKSGNGFSATKRPAFISCGSDIFSGMLKAAGDINSMVGFYANAEFNESGFLEDFNLLEPSGMTIPWKK